MKITNSSNNKPYIENMDDIAYDIAEENSIYSSKFLLRNVTDENYAIISINSLILNSENAITGTTNNESLLSGFLRPNIIKEDNEYYLQLDTPSVITNDTSILYNVSGYSLEIKQLIKYMILLI